MFRPPARARAPQTLIELADSQDLRSVISTALTTAPVDEEMLRRGVWTFVGMERDAGATPADVITSLNRLVDAAHIGPMSVHHARLRQVILWCTEAYFGHLGDDVLATGTVAAAAASAPVSP